MNSSQKHLLFYSNKCQFSEKFLKLLNQFGTINKLFKKHAIENLNNLPQSLTQVPAIVIDGKSLLEGQEAFNWLQNEVKNSFSAGPQLDNKMGYQDLEYSYIGNSENDSLNTKSFSSITNNNNLSNSNENKARIEQKNMSSKENKMNQMLEDYQRNRDQVLPAKPKPPPQPNFSLQ